MAGGHGHGGGGSGAVMDPFDPRVAEWLKQKRAEFDEAIATDKAGQEDEDRRALLMQYAQSYTNRQPTRVAPRQVNDARSRFAAFESLKSPAVMAMGADNDPASPESQAARAAVLNTPAGKAIAESLGPTFDSLPASKLKLYVPMYRATGDIKPEQQSEVLEPALVARAKKVGVPTDGRKREPVIADILAAERAAEALRASATERDRKTGDDKRAGDTKTLDDLRREFQGTSIYKDTVQVAQAAEKITNTAATGPGDISLIFAFMKMVDPGSTVREGEFATAENSGGVTAKVRNLYNKAISGEKLPDDIRLKFRAEAQNLLKAQIARYEPVAAQYRRIATERGLNPNDVVLDMGLSSLTGGNEDLRGAETKSGRPRRTDITTGETREWDGTKWVPVGAR